MEIIIRPFRDRSITGLISFKPFIVLSVYFFLFSQSVRDAPLNEGTFFLLLRQQRISLCRDSDAFSDAGP